MLRNLNEITGYSLHATDGEIGRCKDFLFDDQRWVVRYMLADISAWLPGSKKTLISPISLGEPDWKTSQLPIALSRELIKNSPLLDEHKPVSREYEANFFDYYGYGYYWMGAGPWGAYTDPIALAKGPPKTSATDNGELPKAASIEEGHLRSAKEVEGYTIMATDSDIGHVKDFILNDVDWSIRYIVVDTNNWLPGGRKVLIAPNWLSSVSWVERTVHVNLSAEKIKNSPEYNPDDFLDPEYENSLHAFYGNTKGR